MILIYDFVRKRHGDTHLKHRGLLRFEAHRHRATRFACLGKERFANLKRRLNAVQRLPGRGATGQHT